MVHIEPSDFEGKSEEEIAMMKIMGFAGFNTTKNKVMSLYGGNVRNACLSHIHSTRVPNKKQVHSLCVDSRPGDRLRLVFC